jgi:Putative phage metallopeptidase
MPTFKKRDKTVHDMADAILHKYESHLPLLDTKCRIDFVFAYADRDEDSGEKLNDALKWHGRKALGVARIIPLKERALGRGDAEVALDGDWWSEDATEEQKDALLDHEMHHLSVKTTKKVIQFDDLGRPVLKMRKHDVEVGWFAMIADRHGAASQEQIQAKAIMEATGQYFWPSLAENNTTSLARQNTNTVTLSAGGESVTMPLNKFTQAAKKLAGKRA